MSTAFATSREVSVMMMKKQIMSGIWRTGVEEKICLSCSKTFCCNDIQFQDFSLLYE